MHLFNKQGVAWPPRGWNAFHAVKKSCGQSVFKDPIKATVAGLTYCIEPNAIYASDGTLLMAYTISIDGWNYSILNKSQEFPVLSFQITEKETSGKFNLPYISRVKILSRSIHLNENKAQRVILTSLFLMKQIDANNVPDYERILRLYRIHPDITSRKTALSYKHRADSLFCGLQMTHKDEIDFC